MPGAALILGGASCVWDDIARAREFGPFDATIAINEMIAHYPGEIDAAVTLHPEHLTKWLRERDAKGFSKPKTTVAHLRGPHPVAHVIEYRWPDMDGSGSTGLFAVKTAIELGYTRNILCGVPMDSKPHFYTDMPWRHANEFWKAWPAALAHYKDQTRSMSGRTKGLLGHPDRRWCLGTA